MAKPNKPAETDVETKNYKHPEAESPMRPEVGTQANFRKKKAPVTYKYDSSLSPELSWDGRNPAREQGETLIKRILAAGTVEEAQAAARELAALSKPFLNWAGKAERLSFDVPTLPLFVHERLSTKGIIETLKSHKIQVAQADMFNLFADPQHPVIDQILKAYEYKDKWINRMILGDSLVVMNSLLQYEGMGGQVQMNIRPPAKTLSLSAEALVDASAHGQNPSLEDVCQVSVEKSAGMLPLTQKPVALVFGPESGAVSEKLVHEALKEADLKGYTHLYVIGFAIQPNARMLIENAAEIMIPATYVQATPDLMMGDLLKNMRSSQIFSVCGLPEESVWDHLAGTMSAPFEADENTQIAVKVIDDRGNELQIVKSLKEVG
ncbi:MAG: hypothetical protein WCK00_17795 [Deltaproteobacteria bacterium]